MVRLPGFPYVAIEKSMIEIEKELTPDKPDVAQVTTKVNKVTPASVRFRKAPPRR